MNQGDLIQTNFVNNDQVLEAIPILTANINDVDDLITPTTPTRTTTSESSSKTQSSSTSKSTKSSQTTTSETKSPSKTEGPSGTTSPSGTGSPNRPMGPSGPGGPDGPPPIIGMGLDQSDAHLLTLKSRYSNNSEPQFIVLTIILGYFMMVLYTLWMYHIKTAPSRRGFKHRDIKLTVVQTLFNLISSVMILVYIGFNLAPSGFLVCVLFCCLIPWSLSLTARAVKTMFSIVLDTAKVDYFSVLKAKQSSDNSKMSKNEIFFDIELDLRRKNNDDMNLASISKVYHNKLVSVNSKRIFFGNTSLISSVVFISLLSLLLTLIFHFAVPKISTFANSNDHSGILRDHRLIIFCVLYGAIMFIALPYLCFFLRQYKEAYFLVLEIIICSGLGMLLFIAFLVWNSLLKQGKAMYLPLLTFFILLFVSHILCVVYPQFKMKDYSVAYTIDDYANQDARRATRSMSKNFKSSYSGKTADYRREFLGMLDNEELYSQLREFSKHYLSYSLIQFLDEYQVLKKRILEEYSVEDKVSHRYTNNSNNSRESMISKAHSSDTLSFERSSIKDSESKHSNFSGFYVPTDGLDDKSGYNSRKLTNKSSVYPSVIVDRLLANTPISITISDALEYIFPQAEIFPTSPIPPKIRGLYKFFYSSFIDPNSSLSINLHGSIVDEIIANFKAGDLTVGLFDDAREEVLDLIYFGVFPYYLSSRNIKKVRPTSKVSKISGYILQEKSN
ncbi:hypothetical protein BB558_000174 [Smittium angustum]|uniref:RGS domain-containing protein n=1 Tax=Smittium angustum TaxID=133377 RepID=A0A2U1JF01_SMIAN|nr:hypothetical protein BB558_000174 [Smittium angustum]